MLGSMAALRLPDDLEPVAPAMPVDAPPGSTLPEDPLRDVLYEQYRIEAPTFSWPPVPTADRPTLRLLRISAQAYNVLADYELLAAALRQQMASSGGN
jgi:hypothetical protein